MFLPHQDPSETSGGGRSVAAKYATIDLSQRLSVRFLPRNSPGGYLVRRIVVQGPTGSRAYVYVDDPDELTLADTTRNGAADVADYSQALYVPPETDLWVVWQDKTGANYPAGSVAVARIETEDVT